MFVSTLVLGILLHLHIKDTTLNRFKVRFLLKKVP